MESFTGYEPPRKRIKQQEENEIEFSINDYVDQGWVLGQNPVLNSPIQSTEVRFVKSNASQI
jgi:hypothetical protein